MTRRSSLAPRLAQCAVLALALGGAATMAQAQQAPAPAPTKPAAPAKPATPAKPAAQAKPATPAKPGAAAAGGAAAAAPDAQAAPTALALPWLKRCADDPQIKKQICSMEQTILSDVGQFIARYGLIEVKDDNKMAFTIGLPTGVLLRQGFRVVLANEEPKAGSFVLCDDKSCRGDVVIDQPFLDKMKKAPGVTLQYANGTGRIVSIPVGLGGFAKAYDGAPTDQKAFTDEFQKIEATIKQNIAQRQQAVQQQTQQMTEGLEKLGAQRQQAQPQQ